MSDQNNNKPATNGGFLPTLFSGLGSLLGGASHQPMKKIRIADPIIVSVKTFLGGQGFAKADTTIEVEFDSEAQKLTAEAEATAARIEAEGNAEADKIEAQGRADAERLSAQHGGTRRESKKK